MTNKTAKIQATINNSLRVYTGMLVIYPQFEQEDFLNISGLVPKFNGRYAVNNSTVCYCSDNDVFVTPYTQAVITDLESAGFVQDYFYVPFSNWDYPKYEQFIWNRLLERARIAHSEEFTQDCIRFCEKNKIGELSAEIMANCFEMPLSGVKVKHFYYETTYYPVISNECLDCSASQQIGKFCYNNGRVVFVYRDGKTYVAKGYKITNYLLAAGYSEAGLFVPFSNGEEIQDYTLKSRWDAIKKGVC